MPESPCCGLPELEELSLWRCVSNAFLCAKSSSVTLYHYCAGRQSVGQFSEYKCWIKSRKGYHKLRFPQSLMSHKFLLGFVHGNECGSWSAIWYRTSKPLIVKVNYRIVNSGVSSVNAFISICAISPIKIFVSNSTLSICIYSVLHNPPYTTPVFHSQNNTIKPVVLLLLHSLNLNFRYQSIRPPLSHFSPDTSSANGCNEREVYVICITPVHWVAWVIVSPDHPLWTPSLIMTMKTLCRIVT